MDREATKFISDTRAHAARVVQALIARFGDRVPEDARTLVSFWRASEGGAERAARQLIEFASALGVVVDAFPLPAESCAHDARGSVPVRSGVRS